MSDTATKVPEVKEPKSTKLDNGTSNNLLAILGQNPTARALINAYLAGKGWDTEKAQYVLSGELLVSEREDG
jgi:hypothetical protein